MHLKKLEIRNFRAIAELTVDLVDGANLLVGPNAVGKTTVLEAIRMAKGILAPRTQNEARQILINLGVMSPNLPQQINYGAIARDSDKPVTVNCTFELSATEIGRLPEYVEKLAQQVVAAQHGIGMDNGPLTLVQFLSSPSGQAAMQAAAPFIQEAIARFAREKECRMFLTGDPKMGFRGEDGISQALFAVMENSLAPNQTLFSYFTADRAMPVGETPIQLGAADAQQQLESHNSNPSLKYQRFKNVIFSSMVESDESALKQKETFKEIFETLLREKSIEKFTVNRFGQASILIRDISSDKIFDIDSMSSGEKGLILTLLIMSKAIAVDGFVLIDELELHLNPAVHKDLLDFLLDKYLLPKSIQAIICTHSPGVMSAALRRADCKVFHIRRGSPISPIRRHDQPEAVEALKLLGTSEIEELLYEATVFVEGPDDVELLEFAFRSALARVKFRELMGRGEVEKLILKLQQADRMGQKENISYFLFDFDNRPAGLTDTPKVKVKQWERYCLENYLLEPEVLYDIVRLDCKPKTWPASLGEATKQFAQIAKKQLHSIIVDEVYKEYGFGDIRLRGNDKAHDFPSSANNIFKKIETLKTQLAPLSEADWTAEFVQRCASRLQEREQEWDSSWKQKCNGKQFFKDLNRYAGDFGVDWLGLKKRLLAGNRDADNGGTESWKLLRGTLQDLLGA
ncbi:ATP-dependent nuclease [Silvibacterium acidisoli]|uniref:ATP-dependent nuclease n=1 Tax=Acidobacteriaceae bacterium ZG23-2 TaxID=2883246 RepID=UPI00406C5203